jgi:hypothetical protein
MRFRPRHRYAALPWDPFDRSQIKRDQCRDRLCRRLNNTHRHMVNRNTHRHMVNRNTAITLLRHNTNRNMVIGLCTSLKLRQLVDFPRAAGLAGFAWQEQG